jgi:hypothetical protein
MIFWFKARRAIILIPGIAVTLFIQSYFSGLGLPILDFFKGGISAVPLMTFAPLITAGFVMMSISNSSGSLEETASRPVQRYDALLVTVIFFIVMSVGIIISATGVQDYAGAASRNSAGYVGLMILGWRFVGRNAAFIVPVGFAVVTAFVGRGPDRQPWTWAWPLEDSSSLTAAVLAAICFISGIVALLARGRPRHGDQAE